MTFLTSTALWWAALVLPVIGLYILRVRIRRLTVPTLMFWDRALDRRRERFPWRRFRHAGSLLFQLIVLALLVLAAADPVPAETAQAGGRVVLVIDTSASMSALEGSRTRLARAKEAAESAAQTLGRRHEIAVVTAGGSPAVVQGFTGDPTFVRRAIQAASPTDGPTRVQEAVATARRMLAGGGRIVVLTDLCYREAQRLTAEPDVTVVPVGDRVGNVGITRFQPRCSVIDPQEYQLLVEVTNWSDEPATVGLDLELNDNPVNAVRQVTVAPNGKWSKVFTERSPGGAGGLLTGRISPTDALPTDNETHAVLPDRKPRRVVLVADRNQPGAVFLEHALRANPLVELDDTVLPTPRERDPAALYVFHQRVPERLPMAEPGQPAAGVLVIDPANACDLWQLGEELRAPVIVGDCQRGARQLAYVRLDGLSLSTVRRVLPVEGVAIRPLASAVGGELLYGAFESDRQRVLVLATEPASGDLPLRVAFPILVANAIGWLAGEDVEAPEPVVAGSPAAALLSGPPAGGELWLWPPRGTPRRVTTAGLRQDRAGVWRVPVGELDRAGVWRLTGDRENAAAPPLVVIPCAPGGESEGDLRPAAAEPGRPFWEAVGPSCPIWVWLLAVALVLLVVEWWGYQRRWIA